MKKLDLFGAPTPTKVVSWALFGAGVIAAIGSRFVDDRGWWLGAGLTLIGLSLLVDALLPGGSELTPDQQAMVRHAGIPRPDVAHKGLSLLLGAPLALFGLWMMLG